MNEPCNQPLIPDTHYLKMEIYQTAKIDEDEANPALRIPGRPL